MSDSAGRELYLLGDAFLDPLTRGPCGSLDSSGSSANCNKTLMRLMGGVCVGRCSPTVAVQGGSCRAVGGEGPQGSSLWGWGGLSWT